MDKRRVLIGSGVVAIAFMAGVAVGAQPHMEAALNALENAKVELASAEHNKGGHREKAVKLVEQAIHQVREGIRAGR
jgi:hypothetical protein